MYFLILMIFNIKENHVIPKNGFDNAIQPQLFSENYVHLKSLTNVVSTNDIDRHQMSLRLAKPTKWPVHPAKTDQPGICPVRSEYLLCTWIRIGSWATHKAHEEDAQADQSLLSAQVILLVLSCASSNVCFPAVHTVYHKTRGHDDVHRQQ